MKEFCNLIRLCLISDVQSFTDNAIVLKSGHSQTELYPDDFAFQPKSEISDAGLLYNVELEVPIEKVSISTASVYDTPRSVILQLEIFPDHTPIFVGSLRWPVLAHISPDINKDMLYISGKVPRITL